MKKLGFLFAMLGALLGQSRDARAGIVFGTVNQLQFDNRENEINVAGGVYGRMDVGDRLVGVLDTNEINSALGDQTPPTPEVTGIFDVTVAFIISAATGQSINPATFTGTAFALFRPTNMTGAEGLLGTAVTSLTKADGTTPSGSFTGLGLAAGSAIAIYEGGTPLQTTLDDGTASVADVFRAASSGGGGALQGAFGFNEYDSIDDWGKAGNGYWYAKVTFTSAAKPGPGSTFYYGLNALEGPIADLGGGPNPLLNPELTDPDDVPDDVAPTTILANAISELAGGPLGGTGTNFYDLVGKGATRANNSTQQSPADRDKFAIHSQDPAHVFPSTPEPASIALALMGGGLFVPMARRRRQQKNASAV